MNSGIPPLKGTVTPEPSLGQENSADKPNPIHGVQENELRDSAVKGDGYSGTVPWLGELRR